ncbi:MAG: hypothetical protein D6722_23390 [Bacteroidetes bacterium]|nr:MAG: hypothetical protein D6722_23390 [Bacteroidota bacterium]
MPKTFFSLFFAFWLSSPLLAQFPTTSMNPEALAAYQEGQSLLALGDLQGAHAATQAALRADTGYVDACDQMAEVFRDMGQLDSTIAYYQRSLRLYPRNVRAHQGLAIAYHMQEDPLAAINQYRELLNHHPGYPQAYYGMAKVFFAVNEYEQAVEYSEQAMRVYLRANQGAAAADARMLAGQSYMKQGEYKQAIRYFKASERYFGDRPYYPYYLGFCYLRMGQKQKALDLLHEAELRGFQLPNQVREEMQY